MRMSGRIREGMVHIHFAYRGPDGSLEGVHDHEKDHTEPRHVQSGKVASSPQKVSGSRSSTSAFDFQIDFSAKEYPCFRNSLKWTSFLIVIIEKRSGRTRLY